MLISSIFVSIRYCIPLFFVGALVFGLEVEEESLRSEGMGLGAPLYGVRECVEIEEGVGV